MYSAGIDFGGTTTKVALVSEDGTILTQRVIPAEPGADPVALFAKIAALVQEMAAAKGLPLPPPGGAGIGIPGIVDRHAGRVILSGALRMEDLEIRTAAEEALQCRVALESDANAAALADLYGGAAREAHDVISISWGTGIGAGLILDRSLYHSRGGCMGEFGHTPADPASDRVCYCGCRGCLEIEAGGRAIALQAAEAPDRAAVVERAVTLMARALAGALVLLNPDCVVFAGGVSHILLDDTVRRRFDRELEAAAPKFARRSLTVAVSHYRENAGVAGAAMLPRFQFQEEPNHAARAVCTQRHRGDVEVLPRGSENSGTRRHHTG